MTKILAGINVYTEGEQINAFDNLAVDVKKLYADFPLTWPGIEKTGQVKFVQTPLHKIYKWGCLSFKYRNIFWHLMRRLHLDLSWFNEFKSYWESVLGGRPLWGVYDFYFLRNLYRIKFQKNLVPDGADEQDHLKAWQQPEILYQVFQQALKESQSNKLSVLKKFRQYSGNKWSAILEYGCAAAPVVTSLFEFFPAAKNRQIFIADIQTIAFHYATYKFRNCLKVTPILLTPEDRFQLKQSLKMDTIFCLEVFEHLNQPLLTVQRFHAMLNSRGLLIFDYIKGDAHGLDTQQGVKEREAVLDFIDRNFEILDGALLKEASMGLTIARKK